MVPAGTLLGRLDGFPLPAVPRAGPEAGIGGQFSLHLLLDAAEELEGFGRRLPFGAHAPIIVSRLGRRAGVPVDEASTTIVHGN